MAVASALGVLLCGGILVILDGWLEMDADEQIGERKSMGLRRLVVGVCEFGRK
jgi:hypothetical protein